MFLNHFDLNSHPFTEKPPIQWLLRDVHTDQALARLKFFQQQGAIALIIGQTGLGKSSLLRLFIQQLPQNRYNPVYLHLTQLNANAFLRVMVAKFGEKPQMGKDRMLLQILDDGHITDSLGRKIDFRHTIIIMTSNIGSRQLKDFGQGVGFGTASKKEQADANAKSVIENALKKSFAPEFLNRIDDTIVFRNLDKEDIMQIISIEIKDLYKNLEENKMDLILDQSAKEFLVDKGYDEKYGARPLRRAIQKYIEDPLAEEILRGSFKEGTKIVAKHVEGADDLVFYDESLDVEKPGEESKTPGQIEN